MRRPSILARVAMLAVSLCVAVVVHVSPAQAQAPSPPTTSTAAETVYVAPPAGERHVDRASILAALDRVGPGGVIQFAPGTYLIGELIRVEIPRIKLLGHPGGTILRGCDSTLFADKQVALAQCNGMHLAAGHQTVRDLTFEQTWHALILGCENTGCDASALPSQSRAGGFLIERSTFRESQNGIRVVGQWREPAVIRDNRFINTYHAVVVNGMTVHVLENLISVPEPERVPYTGHPGLALMIGGWAEAGAPACDHNVIARNRIAGHPDAVWIMAWSGGMCRSNEIRDNTIEMAPVRFAAPSTAIHVRSAADSTIVGVPVALLNGVFGHEEGVVEANRIEGNRISGAEGLGIEILRASRNWIGGNTVTGIVERRPFPGNTLSPEPPEWREANGSGIWVSPGSEENEIVGNTFANIISHPIVLEGDRNRVELRSASDAVRDMGNGNRVSDPPKRDLPESP